MEIECKAWVRDRERLLSALRSSAVFVKGFEKRDIYYFDPHHPEDQSREVRLREESGKWVVTFKDKTIRDGVEVNGEHEFSVSDGSEFLELLRRLGLKEKCRKVKRGELYRIGETSVELSDVEGLGCFIEVEKIVSDPTTVEEVRRNVRSILSRLGIPEEDIEPRYYIDMLAEMG
ncbi:MAG TPA: class IV adenylate cyclase [Spirochaetia bacterium]|nr:class IV adenylate cyclase [Spirochaetia bacterium]